MTIRDNFSSLKPTLFLDFMKSKKLDPRITFARSDSTQCATYTDAGGIIRAVPANTPRFNHRYDTASSSYVSAGLLLEEDRTNILRDSAFSSISSSVVNNAWFDTFANITVTSNSTVSPDGTNSGALLSITTTTTSTRIEQRTGSTTAGTYAYSVYCKAASTDTLVRLLLSSETTFTNYIRANFTLSGNGTATAITPTGNAVSPADPIITPVGNGWYRCTIFATLTAPTNITVLIYPGNAGAQTTNSQTYVWGSQLEQTTSNGAFATSYIPTGTSSSVTRAREVTNILTLAPWYNVNEGTLYAEFDSFDFGTNRYPRVAALVDSGGQTNVFQMVAFGANRSIYSSAFDNGSLLASSPFGSYADKTKCRSIFTYDATTFRGTVDGATANGGTLATTPAAEFNRLSIGHLNSGAQLNGHVHQLIYYPKKFNDALMERMTK